MKTTLGVFHIALIEYKIITHRTGTISAPRLQARIRKLPGVLKHPGSVKVLEGTDQAGTFSIFIQLDGVQITHKPPLTGIMNYLVQQDLVEP